MASSESVYMQMTGGSNKSDPTASVISPESVYMQMTGGSNKSGPTASVISPDTAKEQYYNNTKELIVILYEEDGSDIADICTQKLTQDKFQFKMISKNLSDADNLPYATVIVILLTPDMLVVLKTYDKERYSSVFDRALETVLLGHYSVTMNDPATVDTLDSQYKKYKAWRKIQMDSSPLGFKNVLMDIVQIVECSNKEQPTPPTLKIFSIFPDKIWSSHDKVMIYFLGKRMPGDVTVAVVREDKSVIKEYATKRITQTLFSFTPEGLSAGRKKIQVRVEGRSVGHSSFSIKSKEAILSDVLGDVNNPIAFLCQALKLDDDKSRENLDLELTDMFSNGQQSGHQLRNIWVTENRKLELPTLLHLGAKYGLSRFCSKLQEYDWSRSALRIRNKDNKLPYHLASLAGYSDLAFKLNIRNSSTGSMDTCERDSGEFLLSDCGQLIEDPFEEKKNPVTVQEGSVVMRKAEARARKGSAPPLPPRVSNESERSCDSSFANSGGEWTERMTMVWDDFDYVDEIYADLTGTEITHF